MSELPSTDAQRLDRKVVELIPELSRAFAAKLIEQGKVKVNGEIVTKAGFKLRPDDLVVADYRASEVEKIPDIKLPVLYEDQDCVVINKPVGILSHSKGAFNPEPTVGTWLRSRVNGLEGERAGIVHRLDRSTSGVMICAKNPTAMKWLQKQFSSRRVKKSYIAVVEGRPQPSEAIIDMPIERNPKAPATFRVGSNGKKATTHYLVLEAGAKFSLVKLQPETGRTHQLRVHLKYIGHPIVGDTLYGGNAAERVFLHAEQLEITLPNHERKIFKAAVPRVFKSIIKA